MRESSPVAASDVLAWTLPPLWVPAGAGALVVLAFTVVHDWLISDIWFNVGPMVVAGALSGLAIGWSYRSGVRHHSTAAWFGYSALLSAELIALGAVSLAVLEPRFTMAELLVRDDAFALLVAPSMPLIVATMLVGTVAFWLLSGRRTHTVVPIILTQVLLVFLLGHQFAFLGLVESTSQLLVALLQFTVITLVMAAAYSGAVMWAAIAVARRSEA